MVLTDPSLSKTSIVESPSTAWGRAVSVLARNPRGGWLKGGVGASVLSSVSVLDSVLASDSATGVSTLA